MKKRFLSGFLALVLCLGVCVIPALADGGLAMEVTVAGPGGAISPVEKEFVLRDVTVKPAFEMMQSQIHDILTRYDAEERQERFEEVYVLTTGSSVTLSGLRGWDGVESALKASTLDLVNVYAWSDPDGDGVYDQQIFTAKNNGGGPALVVPFSMPGPFRAYTFNESYPWYNVYADLRADNSWYSGSRLNGSDVYQAARSLSASFLTEQFGPDTLIRLELATRYSEDGEEVLDGQSIMLYLPKISFTDVPDWCAAAVDWAVDKEITQGKGGNKFAPDDKCKHGEILAFLWRAADCPDSAAEAPIPLQGDEWYAGALRWAAEKGMIGEGFQLDAPCTRAEAVKYIWQAFDKESAPAGSFVDVPADADYAAAVDWAVALGLTNGYGNNDFRPANTCSRGEIVTFLHRAYVPEVRLG